MSTGVFKFPGIKAMLSRVWGLGPRETAFRALRNYSQLTGGKLCGRDSYGNKYYEDETAVKGRERWVQYADSNFNATHIPAEWHSWLHYVSDDTPTSIRIKRHEKPRFQQNHQENHTGSKRCYFPGHFMLAKEYEDEAQKYIPDIDYRYRRESDPDEEPKENEVVPRPPKIPAYKRRDPRLWTPNDI